MVERDYSEFKPIMRNTHGNTWEAKCWIPVVGYVTTEGDGWESAKMKLWLVCEAVKALESKQVKDPKVWSEDEWRTTIRTMKEVMSVTGTTTP